MRCTLGLGSPANMLFDALCVRYHKDDTEERGNLILALLHLRNTIRFRDSEEACPITTREVMGKP